MATAKEIKEHLNIALCEIGRIEPWFSKEFNYWLFSHPAYPVEYAGESEEEVIKNYPLYLRDFIEERLNNNLNVLTEKRTTGRGGKREGAGRPLGTSKEPTIRMYIPEDIASYLKNPEAIFQIRKLMQKTPLHSRPLKKRISSRASSPRKMKKGVACKTAVR